MLKINGKRAKYLIEKYTDEYHTLYQSIMVDLDINDQSNGEEVRFARSHINPNLTILCEVMYEDKDHHCLKIERLIKNEWYDIDTETFEVIGLCK